MAAAGAAVPGGTQILISNTGLAPAVGQTTFQRGLTAEIFYDFDDDGDTIISQADVWLTGPPSSPGSEIAFVDLTMFGQSNIVPEPSSVVLLLIGVGLTRRKKR